MNPGQLGSRHHFSDDGDGLFQADWAFGIMSSNRTMRFVKLLEQMSPRFCARFQNRNVTASSLRCLVVFRDRQDQVRRGFFPLRRRCTAPALALARHPL